MHKNIVFVVLTHLIMRFLFQRLAQQHVCLDIWRYDMLPADKTTDSVAQMWKPDAIKYIAIKGRTSGNDKKTFFQEIILDNDLINDHFIKASARWAQSKWAIIL